MRKYIVVNDMLCDGKYVMAIYDNYYTALGRVMAEIEDFKNEYKDDGDYFKVGDIDYLGSEGADCGQYIEIKYKYSSWRKGEKEYWYILFYDDSEVE